MDIITQSLILIYFTKQQCLFMRWIKLNEPNPQPIHPPVSCGLYGHGDVFCTALKNQLSIWEMRHHSQISLRYISQSKAYHWSADSWGITYACSWLALPLRSWVSVGTVSKSLEDKAGCRGKASAKTDPWRGDKMNKTNKINILSHQRSDSNSKGVTEYILLTLNFF